MLEQERRKKLDSLDKVVQCRYGRGQRGKKWNKIDLWFNFVVERDPAFQIHKEGRRNREVLTRRKESLVEIVRVGEVGGFYG